MCQFWTIWPQLKISLLLDNVAPIMDNLIFFLLSALFSVIHTLLIIRIIKWIIMYYSDLKEISIVQKMLSDPIFLERFLFEPIFSNFLLV